MVRIPPSAIKPQRVNGGGMRVSRTVLWCALVLLGTVAVTTVMLMGALQDVTTKGHRTSTNVVAQVTNTPVLVPESHARAGTPRRESDDDSEPARNLTPSPPALPTETSKPLPPQLPPDVDMAPELFVDELCRPLTKSIAMEMPDIRFAVQRFQGTIYHVEPFTEQDALGPRGRPKRTIERSQYVPDDVVVIRDSAADRVVTYDKDRITFTHGERRVPDAQPTVSCGHAGTFKFGVGSGEGSSTVTVSYEHLGNNGDMNKAASNGNERARRSHIGREMHTRAGAARLLATFEGPTDFYGLGNRGAGVALPPGQPVRVLNLDDNHYNLDPTITLYGAVPLVYAVNRLTRDTCGIFVLNGSPMEVTAVQKPGVEHSLKFQTTDGGLRYFLLTGPTPAAVLRQYFDLTGRPQLPPMFSIGFHQSRWATNTQSDVATIGRRFDQAGLPNDVLWLDIEHTHDKRYFTWDPSRFRQPKELQKELWRSGRRLVAITDPHIKRDPGYYVYAEAHKHGYFVADESGSREFHGHCWSGDSSWIDFLNPEARRWYSSLFDYDKYVGSTEHLFTWIDMNEPSVFSGPQTTMPMDVRHVNNIPHGQVHNLYGFYHAMAASGGHLHRSNGKQRPFVLTRSFFAGTHRYAAVWTGDNQGKWTHLKASVDMVLLLSLSGITFCGADVGGFFDNPTPELHVRWFQLGSLYPFFRQHSDDHSNPREPYLLQPGPQRQRVSLALVHRYQLMPYLYTAFAQTSGVLGDAAVPAVARHLMLVFPEDIAAFSVTDTFMVGDALLARPVTEQAGGADSRAQFSLFIPRRSPATYAQDRRPQVQKQPLLWYSFCSGAYVARDSPEEGSPGVADGHGRLTVMEESDCAVPLFQRAGTIVPFKVTVGKSTVDLHEHPIELRVAIDIGTSASGILYMDDGETTAFKHGLERCTVAFVLRAPGRLCAVASQADCGTFEPTETVSSIRFSNETLPSWKAAQVLTSDPDHREGSKPKVETSSAASFVSVTGLDLPLRKTEKPPVGEDEGTIWCVALR